MKIKYQQAIASEQDVASPCVRNCCLDQQDVCLGCFRHIDEIMTWRQLDERAKKEILNQCQQRKEQRG
tara:strand:+ start:797 stop:1000 length:204 start_codon:yes stop_codon:yes gene_type:complete